MKQLGRTGEIHNRRLRIIGSVSAMKWRTHSDIFDKIHPDLWDKLGPDLRALEKRGVVKVNRVKGRLPWYRLTALGVVYSLFVRPVGRIKPESPWPGPPSAGNPLRGFATGGKIPIPDGSVVPGQMVNETHALEAGNADLYPPPKTAILKDTRTIKTVDLAEAQAAGVPLLMGHSKDAAIDMEPGETAADALRKVLDHPTKQEGGGDG